MLRIGVNGLGRIGRVLLRLLSDRKDVLISVVNIGTSDIRDIYHLLKYDSVHGTCDAFELQDDTLLIAGNAVKLLRSRDIDNLDWEGVDVVFECTGKFNNKSALAHLRSARHVLVSAPCKDADLTVIYGVNQEKIDIKKHKLISCGSCTTNCLVPVAKTLDDILTIEKGFVTTIHAYTNDQNLVDATHPKDMRRARAASMSMIPTTTGAAGSVGKILPHLAGRLSGAAVRVPVPNVSMIDLTFTAIRAIDKSNINDLIKQRCTHSEVISYTEEELVSIDFNHTAYSAIFDLSLTDVVDSNFYRFVAWYDNEWGFSHRMIDTALLLEK